MCLTTYRSTLGESAQNQEEIVEVILSFPLEFISERIFEPIGDVPVSQIQEQTLEVVKVIPQERLQQRTVEQIVGVPVPPVAEVQHIQRTLRAHPCRSTRSGRNKNRRK